jgi:hypothetical protein
MARVYASGTLEWCRKEESITSPKWFSKEIIHKNLTINGCLYAWTTATGSSTPDFEFPTSVFDLPAFELAKFEVNGKPGTRPAVFSP